jgi:hypothetical protein
MAIDPPGTGCAARSSPHLKDKLGLAESAAGIGRTGSSKVFLARIFE